jgi:hypothetical protein
MEEKTIGNVARESLLPCLICNYGNYGLEQKKIGNVAQESLWPCLLSNYG